MSESLETIALKVNQMSQVLEQYRSNIYTLELRLTLMNKLLEEKGALSAGEWDKRWPLYLQNDVGVLGQDGVMQGSLKVTMYNA